VRDDLALVLGFVIAGVGPLVVATVLSPLREQPQSASIVVVVLVFVIATATVLAGPGAGAFATVTAALSFDFLFIRPYLVLKVDSNDELWPVVLLLAVGLGIVAVAGRRWPQSTGTTAPPTRPRPNQSQHIARVVHLIEQGNDPRDLISAVQAELTGLLLARSCRFEPGEAASPLPRMERNGTVAGRDAARPFPHEDVELPVRRGSHNVGRFVLTPTPGVSIPLEHRIIAVILTDHLAAAIASHAPSAPKPT
jgi:K+-sensing histidine kinase KdpD